MTTEEGRRAQEKAQVSMMEMINDIDRTHLRKIQLKMHQCAVKCCSNEKASLEENMRCLEQCSTKLNGAQEYITAEAQQMQNRLDRCVSRCQDLARGGLSGNDEEAESQAMRDFEQCAIKCVDEHVSLIPGIVKKMKKALDPYT